LQRIKTFFGDIRKSLISLKSRACRESEQDGEKQDVASLSASPRAVFHKVTHSDSGEFQKQFQIMDLRGLVEVMRRVEAAASRA
jgi:hypothetical protein